MGRTATWSPQEDAILSELVASGKTYTRIAEIMQKTKDAVIGRAHRIGCPKRAPAIKPRKAGSPAAKTVRVAPPIPSGMARASGGELLGNSLVALGVVRSAPVARPVMMRPIAPPDCCQWPMWQAHDRRKSRFCAEHVELGRSYCAAHHAVAYAGPAREPTPAQAARVTRGALTMFEVP